MTILRLDSSFLSLLCVLCLSSVSACGARSQKVGGETSWLKDCSADSDCSEGSCLCNVCTRTCDEPADCKEVNRSVCVEPEQDLVDGVCKARTQSICLAEAQLVTRSLDASVSVDSSVVSDDGTATEAGVVESSSRDTASTSFRDNPSVSVVTGVEGVVDTSGSPNPINSSSGAPQWTSSEAPPEPCLPEVRDNAGVDRIPGMEGPWPADNEPGCVGKCAYRYSEDVASFNSTRWILTDEPFCPLDVSSCDELQSELDGNPARCNTVDDCLEYAGLLNPCDGPAEGIYDAPTYFDSALFTEQERSERQAILTQMRQRGCGHIIADYPDPIIYRVECIDNLCKLDWTSQCNRPEWFEIDGGLDASSATSL